MQINSKSRLKQWQNSGVDILLIDVQSKEDFQKRRIPFAVSIPFMQTADFVEEVKSHAASIHIISRHRHIVLFCANYQCPLSKQALLRLEVAGFTNVCVFKEGVEGWFEKSDDLAAA